MSLPSGSAGAAAPAEHLPALPSMTPVGSGASLLQQAQAQQLQPPPLLTNPCASWISCNAPPLPACLVNSSAASSGFGPPSSMHLLELGECRLGLLRTSVLQLTNHSDARVECEVHYTSIGTVEVEPRRLVFAPRQTLPLTVRLRARQLNPHYHKQLLICNAHNPSNVISVLVRSNNSHDRYAAALHNLFYVVLDPSQAARAAASAVAAAAAAESGGSVAAVPPPPPLLPVGFRESASGKIKREDPEDEGGLVSSSGGGSGGGQHGAAEEDASTGMTRLQSRRKSTANSSGRTSVSEKDDVRSEAAALALDDSDLPPAVSAGDPAHLARMIQLAHEQRAAYASGAQSSVSSTATSPMPLSPNAPLTLHPGGPPQQESCMSRDSSSVSLYQQQLMLQTHSMTNTPSHTTIGGAVAAAPPLPPPAPFDTSPQLPPQPVNSIALGTLICNHAVVRAIDLQNVTSSQLRLRLTSSLEADRFAHMAAAAGASVEAPLPPVAEEMLLYVRNDAKFAAPANPELGADGLPLANASPSASSPASSLAVSPAAGVGGGEAGGAHSSSHLPSRLTTYNSFSPVVALAATSPRHTRQQSSGGGALPQHLLESWERFDSLCAGGEHSAVYSRFPDLPAERSYVKKFVTQRRDLELVLKEQLLVRLSDSAAANVALSSDDCHPLGPHELLLPPFATRRVYVYVNMQSQLALPSAVHAALASVASCAGGGGVAAPSPPQVLTFLNKDFHKNKLIRLDERELRMRDTQQHIPSLATGSGGGGELRRRLSDGANVDGMLSGLLSPNGAGGEMQQAEAASFPSSSPMRSAQTSGTAAVESSPLLSGLSEPAAPAPSASTPGLKLLIELVDYPASLVHLSSLSPLPTGGCGEALSLPSSLPASMPVSPAPRVSDTSALHRRPASDSLGEMREDSLAYAELQQQQQKPRISSLAVSIPSSSTDLKSLVAPTLLMSATPQVPLPNPAALPVRSLLLPAFLCRSALEVAQKHINFGQLLNMNVHSKSLLLSNLSEVPLLFLVRQTGSIASLDLSFPRGDIGVIPPLGYADLPFLFKPSLAGKFLEHITILNVQDSDNSRVINVKAYLRKPVHFWIQNLMLDFNICCAANWNALPARTTQPVTAAPVPGSVATTPMRKAGALAASASQGCLSALAHLPLAPSSTFLPSSAASSPPIHSSHRRIVVKNISLKPRTFKIKLVEWERTLIKVKTRVPASATGTLLSQQSDGATTVVAGADAPSEPSSEHRPAALITENPSTVSSLCDTRVESFLPYACPLSLPPLPPPTLLLKLEDVAVSSTSLSLLEREEEEEKLNHKLRIAIRKKKLEKVELIRHRLSELREMKTEQQHTRGGASSGTAGDSSHGDAGSNADKDSKGYDMHSHDSVEGIIFTLEPNAVQNVRATLTTQPPQVALPDSSTSSDEAQQQQQEPQAQALPMYLELYVGILHVYETKNQEIVKEMKCSVALCSDLTTQQDFLDNPASWVLQEEPPVENEEEDEQQEDDEQEQGSNGEQGQPMQDGDGALLEEASTRAEEGDASVIGDEETSRLAQLASPRSARTAPDGVGGDDSLPLDGGPLLARSKSLPLEQDAESSVPAAPSSFDTVPILTEQSLTALEEVRPSEGLDSVGNDGADSSSTSVPAAPMEIIGSASITSLRPVLPSVAVGQLLCKAPSLPPAVLSVLYFPPFFPFYSPTSAPAAQLAAAARTHAQFFALLNSCARGGGLQLPPSSLETPVVRSGGNSFSSSSRTVAPVSTYIPLEFKVTTEQLPAALPSLKSHAARAHSSPAIPRNQSGSSTPPGVSLLPSPHRLLSGTSASIFRVYLENQVPISLPSPSFFRLNSNVAAAMIIEVRWIPQDESSGGDASVGPEIEQQPRSFGHKTLPHSSSFGRSATVARAPLAPPVVSDPDPSGGFMRVFVKPGISLLLPPAQMTPTASNPHRSPEPQLPTPPSTMDRRYRTAAPLRTLTHRFSQGSNDPAPLFQSPTLLAQPSRSLPAQSIFLFVPANGEVDVFMCWLASLQQLHEGTAAAAPPSALASVKRTIRRSMSSVGSHVSSSAAGPFAHVSDVVTAATHHHGSHRWKKSVSVADKAVMSESVLAPSTLSEAGEADDDSAASPIITSPSSAKGPPGVAKPRPSINRASTLNPMRFNSPPPTPVSKPSSTLPKGRLLIRPVGFPSLRSFIGVEVCNVAGSSSGTTHAQVSPLMLTPERIHAGAVLVDMQGGEAAHSSTLASGRRSSSSRSSSALPSSVGSVSVSSLSSTGLVRGTFVIFNSTTARSNLGPSAAAGGRVAVVFGQQTKNTLTAPTVPPHLRPTFHFKPARAVIPANERRVIEFTCHVRSLGYQTHGILVRDCTNNIDIALPVTFTAKEPVFLRFLDTREPTFDAGLIYAATKRGGACMQDASTLHRPPQLYISCEASPIDGMVTTPTSPASARAAAAKPPLPYCTPACRFSKLVTFRVQNPREHAIRVHVACNSADELHVFDGENDTALEYCLSCQRGFCSAAVSADGCCTNSGHERALPHSSGPSHLVLPAQSDRKLLLALSPLQSWVEGAKDLSRAFAAGLTFCVYPHEVVSKEEASTSPAGLPRRSPKARSALPAGVRSGRRASLRFVEEQLDANGVGSGVFVEDVIELESASESDSEGHVLLGIGNSSSEDDEEGLRGDSASGGGSGGGIGTVTGITPSALLLPNRRLAELNVRVTGQVGICTLQIEAVDANAPLTNATIDSTATTPRCSTVDAVPEAIAPTSPQLQERGQDSVQLVSVNECVSTIDFVSASAPNQQTPRSQEAQQSLKRSVRLRNTSSLLPLNFRLVPSVLSLQVSPTSGCLPPLGDVVIELTVSAPGESLQEWVSVLVAQQPSVDYRALEAAEERKQQTSSPMRSAATSPRLESNAHLEAVVLAPPPPALNNEVSDLLGLREELLHTVFVRSFPPLSDTLDAQSPSKQQQPQHSQHHPLHAAALSFTWTPDESPHAQGQQMRSEDTGRQQGDLPLATEHGEQQQQQQQQSEHNSDLMSDPLAAVTLQEMPADDSLTDGDSGGGGGGTEEDPFLLQLQQLHVPVLPASRKAAKLKLLDSILNPTAASSMLSELEGGQ